MAGTMMITMASAVTCQVVRQPSHSIMAMIILGIIASESEYPVWLMAVALPLIDSKYLTMVVTLVKVLKPWPIWRTKKILSNSVIAP